MTQPAYLRIADDLREQIVDGRLAPGDRVPSRHELAGEHGVSDRVAVEAVRLLVSEGYVESRSGSGAYVRRRPEVRRLTRSWYRTHGRSTSPFRADMEAQGRAGTWRSASETAAATPGVAERLGVAEGEPVMVTRYTFLADDRPVMLSTSWEPLGSIVMVVQRTYTGERPLETADIVVPVDRYELAYTMPVE